MLRGQHAIVQVFGRPRGWVGSVLRNRSDAARIWIAPPGVAEEAPDLGGGSTLRLRSPAGAAASGAGSGRWHRVASRWRSLRSHGRRSKATPHGRSGVPLTGKHCFSLVRRRQVEGETRSCLVRHRPSLAVARRSLPRRAEACPAIGIEPFPLKERLRRVAPRPRVRRSGGAGHDQARRGLGSSSHSSQPSPPGVASRGLITSPEPSAREPSGRSTSPTAASRRGLRPPSHPVPTGAERPPATRHMLSRVRRVSSPTPHASSAADPGSGTGRVRRNSMSS